MKLDKAAVRYFDLKEEAEKCRLDTRCSTLYTDNYFRGTTCNRFQGLRRRDYTRVINALSSDISERVHTLSIGQIQYHRQHGWAPYSLTTVLNFYDRDYR